jgi:glutathione S-transferase
VITVHGAALSPFVRKIRAALAEKGIDYQHVHIDPVKKTPEFLAISPLGRIPVLSDGDFTCADSSVIASYLDARYPANALRPTEPDALARTLWLEKFADYELAPLTTFTVFRQRVLSGIRGMAVDEAAVNEALQNGLPPLFDYLESALDGRPFAVGDRLTIADLALAVQFINLSYGGETPDASRWPGISNWLTGILQRPSLASLVSAETAVVQKLRSIKA